MFLYTVTNGRIMRNGEDDACCDAPSEDYHPTSELLFPLWTFWNIRDILIHFLVWEKNVFFSTPVLLQELTVTHAQSNECIYESSCKVLEEI